MLEAEEFDLAESRVVQFWVDGLPKGQPRARAARNHRGVYDPRTADDWKACVRRAARAIPRTELLTGPVAVAFTFIFPRPKSHFKQNGLLIKPDAPSWYSGKPDYDNLDKLVLDVLTKEVRFWIDDAQVCLAVTQKNYGAVPGCKIEIRPL